MTEDFSPAMRSHLAAHTLNVAARPVTPLGGFQPSVPYMAPPRSGTPPRPIRRKDTLGRSEDSGGIIGFVKDFGSPTKQEKRFAKLEGQMIGNAEGIRSPTPGPVEVSSPQERATMGRI